MVDLRIEPVLHDVHPTGKELGRGPYGMVQEVEMVGTRCAAKSLHEMLLEGNRRLFLSFVSECKMVSNLRHPHIVTFLGTAYLNGSLALVMEKLPYNLHHILESYREIPLCLKCSILSDVARGLSYLHNLSILHRDISARNVLLNSGLEAKIGDFGTAKYTRHPAPMDTDAHTQYPGTIVYMPPEAEGGVYGTPLDIFSFGALALFTLTQEFPQLGERVIVGPNNVLVPRSEVERREKYFTLLYSQLNHSHPLVQMIEQCLANDSKKRPTAIMILQTIKLNELNSASEHEQLSAKIKTMEMIARSLQLDQEVNKETEEDIPVKLKPWARKAKPTGKVLGHGTYGIILELESSGETLAGKVFKNVMPHYSSQIEERLYAEVILMATFQHPNLVRFIGVCFLPDESKFPVLLMEKMMTDLYTHLTDPQNQKLLFMRKALILRDVTSGLKYLHERRPALVHRDLTSKNVLLSEELTAKIGDFGTGKIMDLDPEATPDMHTTQPGTIGYMPPEAMTGHAQYDTKIDIFAFGHLALFAVVQTEIPLLPATYLDEKGSLHPRSEVKRRQKSIDDVSKSLGKNHPLVILLKRCLHNSPGQRPCASEILTKIQEIISDVQQKAQEESTVKDKVTLTDEVTLDKLSLLKLSSGERVKIIETVVKDWRKVGIQLNFDRTGNRLDIIEKQKLKDPVACCEAMFQHWLNGNGVKPVAWKTLIDILKDCEYILLAEHVERALTH